jgi:hypothetical protein
VPDFGHVTSGLSNQFGRGSFRPTFRSQQPGADPEIGLIRALLKERWLVNAMQKLIEFYEMASLNAGALGDGEQMAILEARRALRKFARAMESFKMAPMGTSFNEDVSLRLAAWSGARDVPPR